MHRSNSQPPTPTRAHTALLLAPSGSGPYGGNASRMCTAIKSGFESSGPADGASDSVRRMVEDDRDCSEVLVQLAAVKSALNNTGKVILQDHISECIVTAAVDQDYDKIDDLNRAIA